MLVFTRKIDEAIIIGDGIEVKVLRVGRDSVRIGVTAAPHVSIHRSEVYEQIRAANAAAAAPAATVERLVGRLRAVRHAQAGQGSPAADAPGSPADPRSSGT